MTNIATENLYPRYPAIINDYPVVFFKSSDRHYICLGRYNYYFDVYIAEWDIVPTETKALIEKLSKYAIEAQPAIFGRDDEVGLTNTALIAGEPLLQSQTPLNEPFQVSEEDVDLLVKELEEQERLEQAYAKATTPRKKRELG